MSQDNWKIARDSIAACPVGSMQSHHWRVGFESLKALKKDITNSSRPEQALEESKILFDRMIKEGEISAEKYHDSLPNPQRVGVVNGILRAWRDADGLDLKRVSEMIALVERCCEVRLFDPDQGTASLVLSAVGRLAENTPEAPALAESFFEFIASRHEPGDPLYPDNFAVNSLMHVWSKSRSHEAHLAVERHLDRLIHLYQETNNAMFRPDIYTFVAVISTYSRHVDDAVRARAGERADSLLQMAHELLPESEIDAALYTSMLTACVQAGEEPEVVHAKLSKMWEGPISPDATSVATVISAYARRGDSDRAQQLLSQLEQKFDENGDPRLRPSSYCFGSVINALVLDRKPKEAEAVLRQLISRDEHAGRSVVLWNNVIEGWCRAPGGFSRALHLLDEMKSKGGALAPNVTTFTTIINGLSRATYMSDRDRKLRGLLDEMKARRIQPNEAALLAALVVFRSTRKPNAAESFLRFAMKEHLSAVSVKHFGATIHCWADVLASDRSALSHMEALLSEVEQMTLKKKLLSDIQPYGIVINALAKSKLRDAASRADKILSRLKNSPDDRLQPGPTIYTSVIDCWARTNDPRAPGRVEALLHEMDTTENAKPTAITYNAAMTAFARFGLPEKVESLFQKLSMCEDAGMKPTLPHYVTRLQSWSKSGNPEQTSRVLEEMVREYEAGYLESPPNSQSFNAVLMAWYRSGRPEASVAIESGLETMKELSRSGRNIPCAPDRHSYGCAISAYARKKDNAVLDRMYELWEECKKVDSPDFVAVCEVACSFMYHTNIEGGIDPRVFEVLKHIPNIQEPARTQQWHRSVNRVRKAAASCRSKDRGRLVKEIDRVVQLSAQRQQKSPRTSRQSKSPRPRPRRQ